MTHLSFEFSQHVSFALTKSESLSSYPNLPCFRRFFTVIAGLVSGKGLHFGVDGAHLLVFFGAVYMGYFCLSVFHFCRAPCCVFHWTLCIQQYETEWAESYTALAVNSNSIVQQALNHQKPIFSAYYQFVSLSATNLTLAPSWISLWKIKETNNTQQSIFSAVIQKLHVLIYLVLRLFVSGDKLCD